MASWTPVRPRALQRAQERGPERAVFAVADGESEDLPAAVDADAGGDDHGLGDDPVVHAGLAVGGVEEDVGEGGVGQRPVAEGGHLAVEVGADARDLAFGDPGLGAEGFDQVVHASGGHPLQVGLHHHGEQRLVDTAAAFQQGGEERPGPQLGDLQFQIAGGGGQQPVAVAVALVGAGLGALVWGGADDCGRLRLDERLQDGLQRVADDVVGVGGFQRLQQVEQGRLVQSHRVVSSARTFGRESLTVTRWLAPCPGLASTAWSYTTRGDVTLGGGVVLCRRCSYRR